MTIVKARSCAHLYLNSILVQGWIQSMKKKKESFEHIEDSKSKSGKLFNVVMNTPGLLQLSNMTSCHRMYRKSTTFLNISMSSSPPKYGGIGEIESGIVYLRSVILDVHGFKILLQTSQEVFKFPCISTSPIPPGFRNVKLKSFTCGDEPKGHSTFA